MFSSDKNIEILVRLIQNMRRYGELRIESLRLDLMTKITVLVSTLVVLVLLLGVFSLVVVFFSLAAAAWLGELLHSLPLAYAIVGLGYLFFGLLLLVFRRALILDPIANFFSSLVEGDEVAADKNAALYDEEYPKVSNR